MGDDKVVYGHGKGHDHTGDDTGHQIRHHYTEKGIDRGGAQIQGRLIVTGIQLLKPGHDAQYHVGNAESDMGDQDGAVAHADAEGKKQQHQGDTGDDLRIQHGNIGDAQQHGTGASGHMHNGQAGDQADHGGDHRGDSCNGQGVAKCQQDLFIFQ